MFTIAPTKGPTESSIYQHVPEYLVSKFCILISQLDQKGVSKTNLINFTRIEQESMHSEQSKLRSFEKSV